MDGCIYCEKQDQNLLYSEEVDGFFHLACLKAALEVTPDDPELSALRREFSQLFDTPR